MTHELHSVWAVRLMLVRLNIAHVDVYLLVTENMINWADYFNGKPTIPAADIISHGMGSSPRF